MLRNILGCKDLNGQIEISATASNPYTFSGWTGLLSGESGTATTTITMSEPRNLVATFTS